MFHLLILMRSKIDKLHLIIVLISIQGCSTSKSPVAERAELWSQKISVTGLSNIYQIDNNLYRSEQPHVDGILALEKMGIKTVVNLRNVRNDNREGKKTKLQLKHVPINTWTMNYEDVVESLKAINQSKKPMADPLSTWFR